MFLISREPYTRADWPGLALPSSAVTVIHASSTPSRASQHSHIVSLMPSRASQVLSGISLQKIATTNLLSSISLNPIRGSHHDSYILVLLPRQYIMKMSEEPLDVFPLPPVSLSVGSFSSGRHFKNLHTFQSLSPAKVSALVRFTQSIRFSMESLCSINTILKENGRLHVLFTQTNLSLITGQRLLL
jgi:hypothetical protein